MDSPKCSLEESNKNPVKRRRLGHSLGSRNTSWVPPFATPPPSRSSGRQTAESADETKCKARSPAVENESGKLPVQVCQTKSVSPSQMLGNSSKLAEPESSLTPRFGQPRARGSLSARKRFRGGDFKSPMRKIEKVKDDETPQSIQKENERLESRLAELDEEIAGLRNEGCQEEELQVHIKKMHEYNELKDMTQMLLGRIAMLEGVTTRQLHRELGLEEGE